MSSLRDQLLGLGFKAPAKPERKPTERREAKPAGAARDKGKPSAPGERRDGPQRAGKAEASGGRRDGRDTRPGATGARQRKPRQGGGEMDLAKAYAIRAQKEKDERIAAEREKQEQARLRREAQAALDTWLSGVTPLNDATAEIARHFEYGGKIKRIYVTAEQLTALNAGELGVLQRKGRYLLVSAAQLYEAEAIFADAVALKVDPDAPAADDPYADPKYQVPDDLVW